MSMIHSADVVGPSYWSSMAGSIAKGLRRIVSERRVNGSELRKGMCLAARGLFKLALPAADGTFMPRPVANVNAYLVVYAAIPEDPQGRPYADDQIKSVLHSYDDLLSSLQTPRSLTPEEVPQVENLASFFEKLELNGEMERSERLCDADTFPRRLY
jgi:hypothetical protein